MVEKKRYTGYYILQTAIVFIIISALCLVNSPAKGAGNLRLLPFRLQDTITVADTSVAADTTIVADTTLAATDSLSMAEDTTNAFPKVELTPKELKRKIRDSIWAYKDSIIRATPRLLETYIFNDSIKNQRMFLWKTDGYFNKQQQLSPDTTYNDNFNELPYKKNDVDAVYLGVSGSAMQYLNYFKREYSAIFPFFTPYMPYTYTMESMPFYNVKSPYTELAYWGTLLANKQMEETNIKFLHTQNFTPSFNFSILYKRNGASGILENEKTDNRTFAITGNITFPIAPSTFVIIRLGN